MALDYLVVLPNLVASERGKLAAARVFNGRTLLGSASLKSQIYKKNQLNMMYSLRFQIPANVHAYLDTFVVNILENPTVNNPRTRHLIKIATEEADISGSKSD